MRFSKPENIAREIKRLAKIQKRQIKQNKIKSSVFKAGQIDIRRQKLEYLKELKKIAQKFTKVKTKETRLKYYNKYRATKEDFRKTKEETDTIFDILKRREELDAIYAEGIKNESIQFIKGLDLFLRARNIDVTDILLKYDLDSLSDAIYAEAKKDPNIDGSVGREFFGYDKNYVQTEDKTKSVLEAIKKVVDAEDGAKIDKLIKNYSEASVLEGFVPI